MTALAIFFQRIFGQSLGRDILSGGDDRDDQIITRLRVVPCNVISMPWLCLLCWAERESMLIVVVGIVRIGVVGAVRSLPESSWFGLSHLIYQNRLESYAFCRIRSTRLTYQISSRSDHPFSRYVTLKFLNAVQNFLVNSFRVDSAIYRPI